MRETTTLRIIWAAAAAVGRTVLFRLNSGIAWVSGASGPGRMRRLRDGSVVLADARPVALGFSKTDGKAVSGPGDLIGWQSMVVTPDMVGKRVAVFCSIEGKRGDGKGRASAEQKKWRALLIRDGGIAVIADSSDKAVAALKNFKPPDANSLHNHDPI